MERYTCCFFGHREIDETEGLKNDLYSVIEGLIINERVSTFLFGSNSRFDSLCHKITSELKGKYPHIRRVYVRAEFPYITKEYKDYLLIDYEDTFFPENVRGAGRASYVKRNQQMINLSKFCVVYYDEKYLPPRRSNSIKGISGYQPKSGTRLAYCYAVEKRRTVLNVFPV